MFIWTSSWDLERFAELELALVRLQLLVVSSERGSAYTCNGF